MLEPVVASITHGLTSLVHDSSLSHHSASHIANTSFQRDRSMKGKDTTTLCVPCLLSSYGKQITSYYKLNLVPRPHPRREARAGGARDYYKLMSVISKLRQTVQTTWRVACRAAACLVCLTDQDRQTSSRHDSTAASY